MKLSIRWQLVSITCAVIVISFAAFMGIVGYVLTEEYEQEMRTSDIQLSRIISKNISQSLATAFTVERMAAAYPQIMNLPEQEQRALLQRFRQEEIAYELMALVNMDGMQVARSSGKNGDRSNRAWYRDFKENEKNVVSGAYYSASTRSLIVTLVQGIYDGKNPTGLVMGDISTTNLQEFIRRFNEDNQCSVYLLDHKGAAIAQPKELGDGLFNYTTMERTLIRQDDSGNIVRDAKGDLVLEKQPFAAPSGLVQIMHEALAGGIGTGSYVDSNGERQLCVYQPVHLPHVETTWVLVFTRPYSMLMDTIDDLLRRTVMGGALMALLASIGVILFSKYTTRPIFEIVEMAKRVRAGDLSGEIPNQRQDEIGILVDTINHMVQGLRKTEQEKKEAEERIRDMAYHDALTGLPNRTHFMIYARDVLHRSLRQRRSGAVCFVDADKFKFVNDTYGHATGDGLLINFGKRLVEIAGRKELVCRFGGDEFILFLPGASEQEVQATGEAVVEAMRQPFQISGSVLNISASVGIARYPMDATTIDELLQKADAALYMSKRNGRNQYNIYHPGMEMTEDA